MHGTTCDKQMTVAQLIAVLQGFPQDLAVAYQCCSESVLMEANEIGIVEACKPRADGWVQNRRPDMDTMRYLLFPGN